MTDRELIRGRLKTYFRMLAVHDPRLGNELVDVLDAYLDAKFKREWIGLTDEELLDIADMAYANDLELLQTLQAKLKEKNHG